MQALHDVMRGLRRLLADAGVQRGEGAAGAVEHRPRGGAGELAYRLLFIWPGIHRDALSGLSGAFHHDHARGAVQRRLRGLRQQA